MNEKLVLKNLREVKEVFDEFSIKYWLDYGTLLGAVRDGKIIEWDSDIDLGMWDNDRGKVLLATPELKRRKFDVELNSPLEPYHIHLNRFRCLMDIQLYQVKDDKATWPFRMRVGALPIPINMISLALVTVHYILLSHDFFMLVQDKYKFIIKILDHSLYLLPLKLKKLLLNILQCWEVVLQRRSHVNFLLIVPKRYFENLGTIKFYGMTFNIPFDVEDYLKYHYGEDWKMPKKKWDSFKDDSAVVVPLHDEKHTSERESAR
jgi:hypothetical protein